MNNLAVLWQNAKHGQSSISMSVSVVGQNNTLYRTFRRPSGIASFQKIASFVNSILKNSQTCICLQEFKMRWIFFKPLEKHSFTLLLGATVRNLVVISKFSYRPRAKYNSAHPQYPAQRRVLSSSTLPAF